MGWFDDIASGMQTNAIAVPHPAAPTPTGVHPTAPPVAPAPPVWTPHPTTTLPSDGWTGHPTTEPAPPAPGHEGGPPATVDWSTADYSNPATVKAYFASRGVTLSDQTANYWADKYANDPDFQDRGYFFTRLGQDPALANTPGYTGPAAGGIGDLIAPWTGTFNYADFKAPTMDDLKNSPGFQSSLDMASNTLQRSAAAKGSLLSGSTLQSLSDQTADLTSQGYSNLYNQDAQTYQANRANAFSSYQDQESTFYNNQNNAYSRLMGLAALQEQDTQSQRQTNLGYAGIAGQTLSGGAGQYNSILAGGANAQASGIIGQSNAYQGLYGSASQIPSWLLALLRSSGSGGGGGYGYGIGSPGGYTGP